ncbi:unnamed protein product, partial [Symbiodinium necroappetens]
DPLPSARLVATQTRRSPGTSWKPRSSRLPREKCLAAPTPSPRKLLLQRSRLRRAMK